MSHKNNISKKLTLHVRKNKLKRGRDNLIIIADKTIVLYYEIFR